MSGPKSILVWFRRDLRIEDNPALSAAINALDGDEGQVIPVYISAPHEEGCWSPGEAAQWWQHHALSSLRDALKAIGLPLILRHGDSLQELMTLASETRATGIHWNRRYEPDIIDRDKRIKMALKESGIEVHSHNASLLWEPHSIANKSGLPFRVFTPFWKHCRTQPTQGPVALPKSDHRPSANTPASVTLDSLGLKPKLDWAKGFSNHWTPTLNGAQDALDDFLDGTVDQYQRQRDQPGVKGTSRLSPYLQSGQLSPRQIWQATHRSGAAESTDGYKFLSEIAWREFAYHLLFHFPQTTSESLSPAYRHFPWTPNQNHLEAWQAGMTGYPIVDAGMRELWQTGWMHNRVRMIVGSLLVKHLLQPWQDGARWFWDTLVDADLASNTMGWQWIAGCGADAAPYFRIFNPMLQGNKFDTSGSYVRRWVPEIAGLPDQNIHTPWEAPSSVLLKAGVQLGKTYPKPVIDHKTGRQRALDALQANKAMAKLTTEPSRTPLR